MDLADRPTTHDTAFAVPPDGLNYSLTPADCVEPPKNWDAAFARTDTCPFLTPNPPAANGLFTRNPAQPKRTGRRTHRERPPTTPPCTP